MATVFATPCNIRFVYLHIAVWNKVSLWWFHSLEWSSGSTTCGPTSSPWTRRTFSGCCLTSWRWFRMWRIPCTAKFVYRMFHIVLSRPFIILLAFEVTVSSIWKRISSSYCNTVYTLQTLRKWCHIIFQHCLVRYSIMIQQSGADPFF